MVTAIAAGLLGLLLSPATLPPDISGTWTGEGWGQVVLAAAPGGRYDGTYTDTFGQKKGTLKLAWSSEERRFKGTWGEGKDRFGKISVRLVDPEIRGAWTTSKRSRINPGTPELADLTWTKVVAKAESSPPTATTGGSTMLAFSGRESYVVIPGLHYDGSHPITIEATVMSLSRGSIIGDFNGSGLGLDVANGVCAFHVNDGRSTDNGYAAVKATSPMERGRLVHIAGVLDGSEFRLFVGGKLQGSETIGRFNKSPHLFMIGADPDSNNEPTQFLNGFIDQVRISNSARYHRNFQPPGNFQADKHTILLYRFDEGEGDVAHDVSGNDLHGQIRGATWVPATTQPITTQPATTERRAIQQLRGVGAQIIEQHNVATQFSIGNSTQITDQHLSALKSMKSLESLTLLNCPHVSDAGFAHLRHLARLQQLNLSASKITDAGLANLQGLKHLWMLGLNGTRVSDAGLQHLIDNRRITVLYLNNTRITDAGLAFLEQMQEMFWMDLGGTSITDEGLARLGHLSKLKMLSVDGTQITDDGLRHLARFPELELINLNRTAVTDAGLAHLAKRTSLKRLLLSDTRVTVAGLSRLSGLRNLQELQLLNTPIPPSGLQALREWLPADCEITHCFAPPRESPSFNVFPLGTLGGHANHVNSVAFSPAGDILAAGDAAGSVVLWDVPTRQQLRSLSNVQVIQCVDFSPDGKTLVTADRGSLITLWDVKSGREFRKFKAHTSVVMSVAYAPEGDVLASAGVDHSVLIWDATSGEVRATLRGHENAIQEVAFSPDGTKLASVDLDGILIIWNAIQGELWRAHRVDRSGMGLAFSPDGKTLATANYPAKIELWDVMSGKAIGTLMGHQSRVRDVTFSPDGRVLASAGDDQTIRFWDLATHHQIGMLAGHTGRVHDVEFSADGKMLASGSADQTSKLWNVEGLLSPDR